MRCVLSRTEAEITAPVRSIGDQLPHAHRSQNQRRFSLVKFVDSSGLGAAVGADLLRSASPGGGRFAESGDVDELQSAQIDRALFSRYGRRRPPVTRARFPCWLAKNVYAALLAPYVLVLSAAA
jgi:hypothetical protein